jgi:hypothetical protein
MKDSDFNLMVRGLDDFSRRSLLKATSGTFVSVPFVSRQVRANESSIVITTDEYRNVSIATEEVPNKWYKQIQDARVGVRRLNIEYQDEDWLVSIGQKGSDERINGLRFHKIKMGITSFDEAPDSLPSESNGVSVEVVEEGPPTPECVTTCSCVKGGSNINHGLSNGCTVDEPDNGLGIITAAHGFGDCGDDIEDLEVNSCPNDNSDKIGTVEEYSWSYDFAYAEETSDAGISGLDNEILAANYEVQGHVTEDGIDHMISNDEVAHKYGQTTCHTQGIVQNKVSYDLCDNGTSVTYVTTSAGSDSGDSGCPHFRDRDNYGITTVVGIHHGHTSDAWASAAYEINNNFEIEFTNNKSC